MTTRSLDDLRETARSLTPVRFAPAPRRWPWSAGGAVVGALVGAGVVLLLRRVLGEDAPDAQDPADLRAVVDTDSPAA